MVLSVLRFTDSHYHIGIFKLFLEQIISPKTSKLAYIEILGTSVTLPHCCAYIFRNVKPSHDSDRKTCDAITLTLPLGTLNQEDYNGSNKLCNTL